MAAFMMGRDAESLAPVKAPFRLTVRLESAFGQAVRSASGQLIRRSVRTGDSSVRRLTAEWKGLSPAEASGILHYISLPGCFIRYPDPLSGRARAAEFCALSRSAAVQGEAGTGEARLDIEISAQEV